jgi:peptidoglycan/LPS O-acetylase OafA/YrhL
LIWRRYLRLVAPYSVALLLAVATASLARTLIDHPDTPAAPTSRQLLAHFFLLQDILEFPALSTGVWYIAIDLQLYALLVLLFWLGREHAIHALAFLMVAALMWLNRIAGLEVWGIYFFGAYAAGFLARHVLLDTNPARSRTHGVWLIAVIALALMLDWRSRIFIAGLTVMLLLFSGRRNWQPEWANSAPIQWLSKTSYALFLVHYPISVLIGALTERVAPDVEAAALLGLLATWALSMGTAHLLYTSVETRKLGKLVEIPSGTGSTARA